MMSIWVMTMEHSNVTCCHEDEIQTHSRKIEALEVRADYKEKMIDSLNEKMEKMDMLMILLEFII